MPVDKKFLQDVQKANWAIVEANDRCVVGKCTGAHCGLRAQLTPGAPLPTVGSCSSALIVNSFEDLKQILHNRRNELTLSISDTEHASGFADDHLRKMDTPSPTKIPNLQAAIDWANTLGYNLALVPTDLPTATLNIMAETREMADSRKRSIQRREGPSCKKTA